MQSIIYITHPDKQTAVKVASRLLEDRLIACANIYDGVQSLYVWQGKIEQNGEVILLAKSRKELIPKIIETVKEIHPYELPCIVSWAIESGHVPFLNWIDESVKL